MFWFVMNVVCYFVVFNKEVRVLCFEKDCVKNYSFIRLKGEVDYVKFIKIRMSM